MNQKLTLSIDRVAIEQAKVYAKEQGKSLSSMVETFFLLMDPARNQIIEELPISNKLHSLVGISKNIYSENDYRAHLMERNNA